MKTRIAQIDRDTGEVVGEFTAMIFPKRKNGFDRWIAINQSSLHMLLKSELKGRDYQVLFLLLEVMDFDNVVQIAQTEIASILNMQQTHVSRSMKAIYKTGIFLEEKKLGRSRSLKLNPDFGWKGSAKGHKDALKERMAHRVEVAQ